MPPFFLEIDVDANDQVTVRGKVDHRWNANGATPVMWKEAAGSNFDDWIVDFRNGTPFKNNETQFSKNGQPGGQLRSHNGDEPVEYKYWVTCYKGQNEWEADPEIVVWPD